MTVSTAGSATAGSSTGSAGAAWTLATGAPPPHAAKMSSMAVPSSAARAAADRCTSSFGVPSAAAAASRRSLTVRHFSWVDVREILTTNHRR